MKLTSFLHTNPVNTIKTALCSFGMSGRVFHAPFLNLHTGFELVGAWERTSKQIQKTYPKVKSYDTLEQLLNDDIDLVIVNTPTYTHYDYAKEALMAEKNVVVEKAFTTNVGEAEGLKFLAEQQHKMLSVFQNRRWDSDFKTVQSIVNTGVLGNICEAELKFERFNLQLSPKQHKENPGPGAGVVKDLGPHIIDQALCLFGYPQAVFADIRTTRENSLVDDYFEILLYYNNLRVRLKASYIVKEPTPAYIIHGTNGSFLKKRADVQETNLQAGKKPNNSTWGTEPKTEAGILHSEKNGKFLKELVPALQGNYYHYYDEVYKAISFGIEPPITALDGLKVMNIIDAAFLSYEQNAVIALNEL